MQSKHAHSLLFIFLPSLLCFQKWRIEGADNTEPQRSPLSSSPRPLRSSKHSFGTHSLISLSHSLRNYSKFTLIIEYCVSRWRRRYSPILSDRRFRFSFNRYSSLSLSSLLFSINIFEMPWSKCWLLYCVEVGEAKPSIVNEDDDSDPLLGISLFIFPLLYIVRHVHV